MDSVITQVRRVSPSDSEVTIWRPYEHLPDVDVKLSSDTLQSASLVLSNQSKQQQQPIPIRTHHHRNSRPHAHFRNSGGGGGHGHAQRPPGLPNFKPPPPLKRRRFNNSKVRCERFWDCLKSWFRICRKFKAKSPRIVNTGEATMPVDIIPSNPDLSALAITSNVILLPPPDKEEYKIAMVIDLDETLVHSSFKPVENPDFVVPIEIDGQQHSVYVMKRPHVDEFLQKMGELYECILFTASLSKYADPVADYLDQWGVFKARLFREACVFHGGNYVKDLSKLGRDLKRIVILDNSPMSYIFHPDNAVPVISWFDDPHDAQLLYLTPFFERLASIDNVYTVLRNTNHPFNTSSESEPRMQFNPLFRATEAMDGSDGRQHRPTAVGVGLGIGSTLF